MPISQIKPKRDPLKPSPYAFMEENNGWRVFRETYKADPEKDNSYFVSWDIDSEGLSAYDAITRCAELNNQPLAMHPLDALLHLFVMATTHTNSGAKVGARVLLGLYNGYRFPLDLTDLRLLDRQNHEACMTAIRFDSPCRMEVHDWLNTITGRTDMGLRFEWLAWRFDMMEEKPEDAQPEALALVSPLES